MLMMEPRMVGAKVEEVKVRQTVGAKGRYRAEVKERYLVEAVHMKSMHSAAHMFLLNLCKNSHSKLWPRRTFGWKSPVDQYPNL